MCGGGGIRCAEPRPQRAADAGIRVWRAFIAWWYGQGKGICADVPIAYSLSFVPCDVMEFSLYSCMRGYGGCRSIRGVAF